MKRISVLVKELTCREKTQFYNDTCTACGNKLGEPEAQGVFNADTNKPICWDCGEKHSPELVGAIRKIHQEKKQLKEKLLAEYAQKDPKKYFQIDVWPQDGGDCVFTPDEDGLVTSGGIVHELRISDFPLRVQIHESANLRDTLKGLDRAKDWVQRYIDDPERMFKDYEPTEIPF